MGDPHNGAGLTTRRPKTPEQVLDALMHSKDETIRLRAADAFLKRQERQTGCPTCQAAREDERERMSTIHRLTYEQRCHLRDLTRQVRDILDAARSQPLTWDEDRLRYMDEPAPDPIVAPPPVVPEPPVFDEDDDAEEEEEEIEDDRDPLTIPPDEL